MKRQDLSQISRRERQIMDILIEHQRCSASDVRAAMPDAPSYSAVRALLARLVEKALVDFSQEGTKYVYFPKATPKSLQRSAIARFLNVFFKGSRYQAVNALLEENADAMESWEIDRLERRIKQLKEQKAKE